MPFQIHAVYPVLRRGKLGGWIRTLKKEEMTVLHPSSDFMTAMKWAQQRFLSARIDIKNVGK